MRDSREAHAKQKQLAQERKAAKPHADDIARSKKLWERLRRKSHVPLEERKQLVAELFGLISGRVKDFVFKHDSVRVVQTALKYANLDQRTMIAEELRGEYKTLAESKYAKFLVGKILVQSERRVRDFVVPEFYGHVRRMIKHPEAAWILDDVYRGAATPQQKATLLREWYGPEFAIFKSEQAHADLSEILRESPEKKKPIMSALYGLINLLLQKKTTAFTMLHDAMLQYYLNVPRGSEDATQFMELLLGDDEGDLLKNLAFTASGSRLVCLALAHGTAKDRKLLMRAYKGTVGTMAFDANAHRVLLTALDVIDDTVLTGKGIISELRGKAAQQDDRMEELLQMVNDLNARATLAYLFCGSSNKGIMSADDIAFLDEMHQIRQQTSKKDAQQRRHELLTQISPPMLEFLSLRMPQLTSSSFGCQFVAEIMLSSTGDRQEALEALHAVVDAMIEPPALTQDDDFVVKDGEVKYKLAMPAASRMLKNVIQGGRYDPQSKSVTRCDPPLGFAESFYRQLTTDTLTRWALGPHAFLIVGLLESPDLSDASRQELRKSLARHRKELEKAGTSRETPSGNKKHGVTDKGNAGARMILSKLE